MVPLYALALTGPEIDPQVSLEQRKVNHLPVPQSRYSS